ncbi:hypothetical protein ACIHFD_57695 [Nonomuraea sp. NPDC051941]|uniref:hypothetical protein n=1 Tax=Nonomuraea sp. NPDC051941 TaxID=3364373 RepID=UPI0037CB3455
MSKTTLEAERAPGSRLWRGMAIIALVVLVASLVAGLLWFFADPLHLPPELLSTLDQRASVIGMFTGMLLGAAGLVVAVVALRAQTRADRTPAAGIALPETATAEQKATQVAAEGERSIAIGGDNSGIVSTGDGARNVQPRAQASGQGRGQAGGGAYGGDHLEFHHNIFTGKVVGKQVSGPEPAPPDGDDDERC